MKVWCVIQGQNYAYDGESFSSLRVFSSEEKADACYEQLVKDGACDFGGYVDVEERDVE